MLLWHMPEDRSRFLKKETKTKKKKNIYIYINIYIYVYTCISTSVQTSSYICTIHSTSSDTEVRSSGESGRPLPSERYSVISSATLHPSALWSRSHLRATVQIANHRLIIQSHDSKGDAKGKPKPPEILFKKGT